MQKDKTSEILNNGFQGRIIVISCDNKVFIKSLAYLSVPIIIQELLNSSVNLLDSFMIGSLGLDAINGVGFANQIFFLMALIMFGVNSGSSIFMGQFWGKRDSASIRKVMGICFVTNMAAATVFALAAWLIPDVLIGFYSDEAEVIRLGREYIRVAAFTYFILAFTMTINTSLKSIGQTRLPMATTFAGLLVNATLNYVFIYKFNWGVTGAALATVIARLVEITAQIILLVRLRMPVAGKVSGYFTANKPFVREYFKMTIPVILNEFVWALGTTTYTIAYRFCGNASQGAVQIANSTQSLFMVIGLGVGSGCGIMLANLLGAGENEKAISYSRKSLVASVSISVIMGILLFAVSPAIVSIYNVDEDVKIMARQVIIVIAIGLTAKTYNFTTIVGILRSGGDTKYCLKLDMLGVWAIGVPMAFLGAALLGLPVYIVVAMVFLEEAFKVVFSSKRVFSNVWAVTVV